MNAHVVNHIEVAGEEETVTFRLMHNAGTYWIEETVNGYSDPMPFPIIDPSDPNREFAEFVRIRMSQVARPAASRGNLGPIVSSSIGMAAAAFGIYCIAVGADSHDMMIGFVIALSGLFLLSLDR